MLIFIYYFFSSLSPFLSQTLTDNCQLHLQGISYSLLPLSSDEGWTIRDYDTDSALFSIEYLLNLCKPVSLPCNGEKVPAFSVLTVMGQITDTCEILGRDRNVNAKFIDENNKNKGFKLTYENGDICKDSENAFEEGQPMKVNFKVICNEKQDSNWEFSAINSVDITKCNLEFNIHSPVGCLPGHQQSESRTNIVLYLIIILALYFGGGIMYNQTVNQLTGKDALPHKEF